MLSGYVWGGSKRDCSALNEDGLWNDLAALADDSMQGRKAGSVGAQKAREYISTRYAQIGLHQFNVSQSEQNYFAPFERKSLLKDFKGVNVAGWLKGSEVENEYIVVSAHYDHIGRKGRRIFNGADDNASGVAALIALASAVSCQGSRYSVIFLATDHEETGLIGAKAFIEKPLVPLENIKINLNLDMLAQGGRNERLYLYRSKYPDYMAAISHAIQQSSTVQLKERRRRYERKQFGAFWVDWKLSSDHGAFASADIPFVFLGVDVHRYYHTDKDTIENLSPDFYFQAVQTTLSSFRIIDNQSL